MFLGSFALLPILRNKVVEKLVLKLSRSTLFSLETSAINNVLLPILIFGALYFIGIIVSNATLILFAFGTLVLIIPLYLLFVNFISEDHLADICFEALIDTMDDYEDRQIWFSRISEMVVRRLRIAGIKASASDFVFHFNMELLKGNKIDEDLKCVHNWLNYETPFCYRILNKIYSSDKLKPTSQGSLFERSSMNQAITSIAVQIAATIGTFIVFLVILAIVQPQAIQTFVNNYLKIT